MHFFFSIQFSLEDFLVPLPTSWKACGHLKSTLVQSCAPPPQIFFSPPVSPDFSHVSAPESNLVRSLPCLDGSQLHKPISHMKSLSLFIVFASLSWVLSYLGFKQMIPCCRSDQKKKTLHLSFKDIRLLVQLSSVSQAEFLAKSDFFLWIYGVRTSKVLSSWFDL